MSTRALSNFKARLAALALALTALPACYELRQASGQLSMFLSRRSIASVIADPSLDAAQRDRLRVAWFAREFALRELGLEASESYQSVVLLDRPAVSYVVAAAPADRLEAYRWCFPFAGCLPYIGYFDRRDAVRERDRLRSLGYDTQLRGVDAYSLGGWFPDPLYSPILHRARGSIANTVIHELTHGTVFIPGEARFNESLASFVGDRGSLLFLTQRYGADSSTVRETLAFDRDEERWETHLRSLARELEAVYATRAARPEKLSDKARIIERSTRALRAIPFETRAYRRRASLVALNNAELVTHSTYSGDRALLERAFVAHGSNLRAFVRFMRDEVARQPRPAQWLAAWVDARSAHR
ncbi:MAG: aminopeptidase [Polyangiales bacterium]